MAGPGCCGAHRCRACCPPPTTWAASTASSRRSTTRRYPSPGRSGSARTTRSSVLRSTSWTTSTGSCRGTSRPSPAPSTSASERQLRRWSRQWERSKTRELPAMEEIGRRLAANLPAQQGPGTIVHGDYRLDNLIVSPAGEVVAVLDWELCTLGDPLADVGLLMVYWSDPGDDVLPLDSTVTALPGFPRRAEVAEAYATASGRDLSQLDFYVAFGYWKLAAILEGVYARFAAGAYGSGDDAYRRFAAVVERLAERALDATIRAGR